MTSPHQWIQIRPQGLYIEPAGLYLDPVRRVDYAIISHGHADHARPGHTHVMATAQTLAIMRTRYGRRAFHHGQPLAVGENINIHGVDIFMQHAGHVLGSTQIALQYEGTRVVYSGDYKPRADATCAAFEPIICDVFITEATFGLPVFRHPPAANEMAKIRQSLRVFPDRCHVIGAYALGKAQRMIKELRQTGYDRPIFLHRALQPLCELYQHFGIDLGELRSASEIGDIKMNSGLAGEILLAPPMGSTDAWTQDLADPLFAMASGWMTVKKRSRSAELPLIISDHADWDELLATCAATQAEEVWITHGREEALIHALSRQGVRAKALSMIGYKDEQH